MEDLAMTTHHAAHACREHGAAPLSIDPVCGMKVDPTRSKHRQEHEGKVYHFCCGGCAGKFAADPGRYLATKQALPPPPASADAVYTCPMHPEVRQVGPGACPICGMALEPEAVTVDAAPNPELADMSRRFWIALVLALPVVLLENGMHLLGDRFDAVVPARLNVWLQLVLATPVVLWAGWPFFLRGWASLRSRHLNMFTLIALGTGVAWTYSLVAALAPGLFPPGFRRADGGVAVYFEAASVITTLVLLGQVLELRARERTGGAIRALLGLAPKTAHRVRPDGSDEEIGRYTPTANVSAGTKDICSATVIIAPKSTSAHGSLWSRMPLMMYDIRVAFGASNFSTAARSLPCAASDRARPSVRVAAG